MDLPNPRCRDHGGRYDRWAYYRTDFPFNVWDALCGGRGEHLPFVEYNTPEAAREHLAAAITATCLEKPGKTKTPVPSRA